MKSIAERLADKCAPEPNTGCWLWTGAVNPGGYGHILYGDKTISAHRASYELHVGPIPEGLHIDHLCRVRSCINPDHLEPVTRSENARRGLTVNHLRDKELAKTHCPSGHPYSGSNLIFHTNGGRLCRACRDAQNKKQRQRRKMMGIV
jgi:hypothetical protein